MNMWLCLAAFLGPSAAVAVWILVAGSIRAIRRHG